MHCYKGTLLREKELYYVEGLRYADGSEFHLYMAAKRAMCISDILYRRRVRENSQITSKVKIHYLESLIVLFVEEMRLWNGYGFSNEINCGIEKYFRLRHREILDMYQQLREYKGATPILDKWPSAKYFYNHIVKQIPVCIDKFSKEEEKKMYQAKAIYVYGAGFMATEVAKVLDYKGFDYKCVVTNKNSSKDSFNGREILSIDIGFGDIVTPSPVQIEYPLLLDDKPAASLLAYSAETVVAEKFDAMISLSENNSRMKDFDVYRFIRRGNLDKSILEEAISVTFSNRGTSYQEDHPLFTEEFANNSVRQTRWRAFLKRIKYPHNLDFPIVMSEIRSFLLPYWLKQR